MSSVSRFEILIPGPPGTGGITVATANASYAAKAATEAALATGNPADIKGTGPDGVSITNMTPGRIDARHRGLSSASTGTENAALIADLLAEAKPERKPVFVADGTYTVDGIDLTYDGDTPDATGYGYPAAPLVGNGPRATVLQHSAGSTDPLVSVVGSAADSNTSHTGKVSGAMVQGFELRGQGKASGNATPLVSLSIYEYAALRDLYLIDGGGDGIQLRRPVRTASRDDYSHGFELENIKILLCGGDGISTPDDHAVGYGTLINAQAHSCGGYGFDLIAANITLLGSATFANALGGVRSRNSQGGSISTAEQFVAITSRFEGDAGIEVDLQGGAQPSLINTSVKATHANGYDAIVIGNSGVTVRNATIVGGYISGNGGASGTAGQKAVRIGGNATGTVLLNPRIDPSQFNDAYAANDPMYVVVDGGADTALLLGGRWRSTVKSALTSSASLAYTSQLYSQAFRKWGMYADGRMEYGTGSAAPNLDTGYVVGSPEGVTTANPGSLRWSTDGNLYVKKTGTGNTGWKAVTTAP